MNMIKSSASKSIRAYSFALTAVFFLSAAGLLLLVCCTPMRAVPAYLLSINLAAFVLCGYDKLAAARQGLRIPENVLFLSALAGGALGLLAGMRRFRHKTRKASFQLTMLVIGIAQVVLLKALRFL